MFIFLFTDIARDLYYDKALEFRASAGQVLESTCDNKSAVRDAAAVLLVQWGCGH